MHRRRPSRLAAFSYLGRHRYFLTTCTSGREPVFTDARLVEAVRWQILNSADVHRFAVLAYCFMPDHLHLLVEGLEESSDLPRFMKEVKGRSGLHARRLRGKRLWQDGYYEHVLRDDEATERVMCYVLENPVRAGLVAHIADYPFVGSGVYRLEQMLDMIQGRGGTGL